MRDTMNTPLVTVIMPVYNAEKYLRAAIESILKQTYINFEFLIFDDGSTDSSVDLLRAYTDPRIQLFIDGQNLGQPKRYNAGIRAAKGKYIAIMHADDISLPHRFATQVKFLEENKDYALVGSRARLIFGERISKKLLGIVGAYAYLKYYQIFYCPIVHPTVMGRTNVFKDLYYNEDFYTAEDYEFWSRALWKYKMNNFAEPVYYYRVHAQSNQIKKKEQQLSNLSQIMRTQLNSLNVKFTEQELKVNLLLSGSYDNLISRTEIEDVNNWLTTLYKQLVQLNPQDKNVIFRAFSDNWIAFCRRKIHSGFFVFYYMVKSQFFNINIKNLYQIIYIIIKFYFKNGK